MNSFQVGNLDSKDVDQLVVGPTSDLSDGLVDWRDAKINDVSPGNVVKLELKVVEGDSSVGINCALESEAENVIGVGERGRHSKWAEKRLPFFESSLKADDRHLAGSRVDAVVIVVM